MKLTDEEKEMLENLGKIYSENPLNAVDEGLISSYYNNNPELISFSNKIMKQILVKIAKDRNIDIGENETYLISNETVFGDSEPFIGVDIIRNIETLKDHLNEVSNNMSAEQLENLMLKLETMHREMHSRVFIKNIRGAIKNLRELMNESGLSFDTEEQNGESTDFFDFGDEPMDVQSEEFTSQDESNDVSMDEEGMWDIDDSDFNWSDFGVESVSDTTTVEYKKEAISDEEIRSMLSFFNSYDEIMAIRSNLSQMISLIEQNRNQKRLEEFKEDKEFYSDLQLIMSHDEKKHQYMFHGTQCIEDAESIINQGLGMMQDGLDSTAYPEFSIDELLLYSRGFMGEIGRDAVVIIDVPIEDGMLKNIVEEVGEEDHISFTPSGLQGLNGKANFKVNPNFIVGFVNKRDRKVILNPKYYDYQRICDEKNAIKLKDIKDGIKIQKNTV